MILTGPEIAREREAGRLVLDPFDAAQVQPNSYNLALGPTLAYYTGAVLDTRRENPWVTVPIPAGGFVLRPDRIYLGSSVEVLGSNHLVPVIRSRSGAARLGLFVHVTADLIDIEVRRAVDVPAARGPAGAGPRRRPAGAGDVLAPPRRDHPLRRQIPGIARPAALADPPRHRRGGVAVTGRRVEDPAAGRPDPTVRAWSPQRSPRSAAATCWPTTRSRRRSWTPTAGSTSACTWTPWSAGPRCAEAGALSAARLATGAELVAVAAVRHPKPTESAVARVVPPCGLCRELLLDHAPGLHAVVHDGTGAVLTPLSALLPHKYTGTKWPAEPAAET
ncbi:dCTP deaminase domain-containing protein [Yinghuangia aomiensis]